MKHLAFIGRFVLLHNGHAHIIRSTYQRHDGNPVLILVRDTDEETTPEQRKTKIEAWLHSEGIPGVVQIIPDIEGVYYGRGVGYVVDEIEVSEEIKAISATDLKARRKAGDPSWKELVPSAVAEFIETKQLFC